MFERELQAATEIALATPAAAVVGGQKAWRHRLGSRWAVRSIHACGPGTLGENRHRQRILARWLRAAYLDARGDINPDRGQGQQSTSDVVRAKAAGEHCRKAERHLGGDVNVGPLAGPA